MFNPLSTYRVQFHSGFTFQHLRAVLPYLKTLGIRTIYASPIFASIGGSTHGYDTVSPLRINPEIGTEEELRSLREELTEAGMYWLQDIVPNHMAFDYRNEWLYDVLENGRASRYASVFDIDWEAPGMEGRLMVPFLGSSAEEAVNNGHIQLVEKGGVTLIQSGDQFYPLRKETRDQISSEGSSPEKINADKEAFLRIVNGQHYALCSWQDTDRQINYRRFFTVNQLICTNMQNEDVFREYHSYIAGLTAKGLFDGLRIDHVDGLQDPEGYLQMLRELVGPSVYISVEKILEPAELLPESWPVAGTTGYDMLALINNLLPSRKGEKLLRNLYSEHSLSMQSFELQLRQKKALILNRYMNGELDALVRLFLPLLTEEERSSIDESLLRQAIGAWLIYCPVYRYYGNHFPLSKEELTAHAELFSLISSTQPELADGIAKLEDVLLNRGNTGNRDYRTAVMRFYQRSMQYAPPLMAKGFEDTLMYGHHFFIAHNEVGDAGDSAAISIENFHKQVRERSHQWPLTMNATATHDTKRGEDVRARLNALSEVVPQWIALVRQWGAYHASLDGLKPDANDAYFIYQVVVGHYPMPGEKSPDFRERLRAYLQKALRESKRRSSWSEPNEGYEEAAADFAEALIDPNASFHSDFIKFYQLISDYGILNSLTQTALRLCLPGVADTYQGTEGWDLSFVDPDNRRPVPYDELQATLQNMPAGFDALWEQRYNGAVKLWLTHQLLQLRKEEEDVFAKGSYLPLEVRGRLKDHVLAFARMDAKRAVVCILPLHLATLMERGQKTWNSIDWKDTSVQLPPLLLPRLQDHLGVTEIHHHGTVFISNLFSASPLAILKGELEWRSRGAGVLLHITSLPSRFGIGDMGSEAYHFANWLHDADQHYWQLLPLNPTEDGQSHSPYSATSSKAGNPLFISPERMADEGWLHADRVNESQLPVESLVDYGAASAIKETLFEEAWSGFQARASEDQWQQCSAFYEKEKDWLHDYALYVVAKKQFNGQPWFNWPAEIKWRKEEALALLLEENRNLYEKTRWLQSVFARQWSSLRNYCNEKGIRLVGDVPFYVSYDSADVWSAPGLFKLDHDGKPIGMAGVPPDAFSEDGQLWGMPVFRWEEHRKTGYEWWIRRLQKNTELFDLTRLDHFRAFAAWWEVPAGAATAKEGKWIKGPGAPFFTAVKAALGDLPFIAEDLGDIDEDVYRLRDRFSLPGMKVLQFAFGDEVGESTHSPHNHTPNHFVYTGTHDNNTTRGWWRSESPAVRSSLQQYATPGIDEANVAFVLCKMAYGSVANVAIVPLQDLLSLDETARMNQPSSTRGNWGWRLRPFQLPKDLKQNLLDWTKLYRRAWSY